MADATFTVASVKPLEGCIIRRFTVGADTLTPGMSVYVSADNTVAKARGNAFAALLECIGMVVSNASGAVSFATGDTVDVVLFGPVTGGLANIAGGSRFFVSNTAGGITQNATGTKVCFFGIGLSTTTILVAPAVISVA